MVYGVWYMVYGIWYMVYGLGNKGSPSPSLDPMYVCLPAYLTITSNLLMECAMPLVNPSIRQP